MCHALLHTETRPIYRFTRGAREQREHSLKLLTCKATHLSYKVLMENKVFGKKEF
jgi:hypothetical protein